MSKKLLGILVVLVLLVSVVGGYSYINAQDNEVVEDTTTEVATTTQESETNDYYTIEFDESITTDSNAQIEDNNITITEGGDYLLTGTSSDAQVIINAPGEVVNLTFDNLNLKASTTSAITGIDAEQINIELVGDNYLEDTANNTDDYQAPLYVDEIEMTIDGDGVLNLTGNYKEGLETNNDIYINGGTYNITAADDGINAGDLLVINGGTLYIECLGDGLDSNGSLEINGGETYVVGGNENNGGGDGALDYGDNPEDTFEITGGVVIAAGGEMPVNPTSTSQQVLFAETGGYDVEVGDYTWETDGFMTVFITYPELTSDTPVYIDGVEVTTTETVVERVTPESMGF